MIRGICLKMMTMFRNNNYIFFNLTLSFFNFYCKNIYIINFQGKKKTKPGVPMDSHAFQNGIQNRVEGGIQK